MGDFCDKPLKNEAKHSILPAEVKIEPELSDNSSRGSIFANLYFTSWFVEGL